MKKNKYFLLSLILSAALITGCGGIHFDSVDSKDNSSSSQDSSDTSSGDSSSSSGSDSGKTGLDYTKSEAQNKLKTLGRTSGFEIGLEVSGQNEETGAMETDSATLGYKVDVLWVDGEVALKQTPTETEIYYSTQGAANQYDYEASAEASIFETYVDNLTQMFFVAYEYNAYLKETGTTTFLGRSAKVYAFTGAMETIYADMEVIVDNETGITLKLAAQGQAADGTVAAGSLIVTSFKIGDQVRKPTLNKNSGEGGGGQGGGGETEKLPKAGKYSYDGTRSRNPGMFAGGYFEIDEQGDGIFCDYPDYLGEKHYYTGTFVLSGNDIVMTTVFGILESNGRITNTTSMDGAVFTFTSLGEDSYGIALDNSYIVYKYGEGGDPQPVDLSKYMATAAQYAHYITDMTDIGKTGNLKYNVMYKVNNVAYQSTTLENNYGNYYEGLVYLDNNQTVRMLYVQVQGRDGYYDMYHWEDGGWKKGSSSYPMDLSLFADKVGLLALSYVPFNKFSEPTDASDPCYTCAKFDYENDQTGESIHLTNIKLYFVDGVLDKYSYKTANNEQFDVQITDRGHVDFEIPEEQQQPQEVQDNALLSGQNGAHFVFNRADMGNYTGHDLDNTIDALEDTSFNFYTNGNVEMIYSITDLTVVTLGTYTLMKKEGVNQATARLAMTERYVNDLKNDQFDPTTLVQYYYIQEDELHIIQTGTNGLGEALEIHIIYTRSTDVPTPYNPSAVTPPEESKWPADNIAKKLQELEINVKLPAAKTPNEGINEVVLSVESNSLVITVKFNAYSSYSAGDAAMLEFAQYMAALTDFTMNYSESDTTNGVYAFVAKDGKSMVKLHYVEGQTTLKIVVSKYNANAYPADKIREYLANNRINVTIPSLEMDGVSYQFIEDNGLLMITPTAADVTLDDILSNCYTAFAGAGFKRVFMAENSEIAGAILFDEGLNCVVSIATDSGIVALAFMAYDQEMMGNFSEYPKTSLDESYPEGVRDSYPSFAVDGATYFVKDMGDNLYELSITLQEGQNMTAILRELNASLTAEAGYVLTNGKYVSANGQIEITITGVDNVLILVDIQYLPPEDEIVTYTFTNTSGFNIFDSNPQFYAYVWDNKGEGHWEELRYDEETGKFILEVSSYMVGCKIVRFATESEIDWAYDGEGRPIDGVEIWNETDDIALSGESSSLEFVLH